MRSYHRRQNRAHNHRHAAENFHWPSRWLSDEVAEAAAAFVFLSPWRGAASSLNGQALSPSRHLVRGCVGTLCLCTLETLRSQSPIPGWFNTDSRCLKHKSRLLIKAIFDLWYDSLFFIRQRAQVFFLGLFETDMMDLAKAFWKKELIEIVVWVIRGDSGAERMSPDYKCPDLSHILIDRLGDLCFPCSSCALWNDLQKKKKRRVSLSQIPAANALAKGHNISLFSIQGWRENSWSSPVIDFSEGCLEFHCATFDKRKLPTQGLWLWQVQEREA